uniref:DDE Tnp4 domain-containing protein n=1 Tax=Panagrellus redivivus TaxID=6233 RepID=A0A7E4ZQD0_PANRE
MKRRYSHRRSPSIANASKRPRPEDHIFTPEVSPTVPFNRVQRMLGKVEREERKREWAGIPPSPDARPTILPLASSTPRRPVRSNHIWTPEVSPKTLFNKVQRLQERADPTGERREYRQRELQRKEEKLIRKYIKTPVVTESEDESSDYEDDEEEEGKMLMELCLFEGELTYPVTAHVDVDFEEFECPEFDQWEAVFAERPPHTILMQHAYALAPVKILNYAAECLANKRHECQINAILLFYAYYMQHLKKFLAARKPLTSFVGETFEVDLGSQFGVRAILEMVEIDTVAMHVRGQGWTIEQHLKSNDAATGFVGGGNIVFGDGADEVGIDIDISSIERMDVKQVFHMFGKIKAVPTASNVVGSLVIGENSDVGVDGYSADFNKPHICVFIGKTLYGAFKIIERERVPSASNNWVDTYDKMVPFDEHNFDYFAELIKSVHILLNEVAFTDSRNRRDVQLMQEGKFDEAERIYKHNCLIKFREREEMPPRSMNFRRRCVNGKKFYELRVHPVAGDYFNRKKKKFSTAFDWHGWKKLGQPWGQPM